MPLSDLGVSMSWRRLGVLIRQLPAKSRVSVQVHGDSAVWGVSEYLLAAAVDALHGGNWQRGGGKGRRPSPVPRPQGPQVKAKPSSPAFQKMFAGRAVYVPDGGE